MDLRKTFATAGRAALRTGTVAAVAAGARQLRARARQAKRAQRRRSWAKGAIALAVVAAAGALIRSRMA